VLCITAIAYEDHFPIAVISKILMISLDKCAKILNKGGKNFDKDEIELIRDFLYKMGGLVYEVYKANQKEGIPPQKRTPQRRT
jgi:hypothetical protein